MAPQRKGKNKMIDAGECSAAANKKRRNEILNGVNGVPFTTPITQFPSTNFLRQQRDLPGNTIAIGTDLQLSPPSPIDLQQEEQVADDDFVSWLIPQQNFIINYHVNLMLQSMEEFWKSNLAGEVQKRKEIEAKLKEKEEQSNRFRQMYQFYEKRTFNLEEILDQQINKARCNIIAPVVAHEEEVQSCLVDLNGVQRMDVKCKNCFNRPATMLWLPCRHLSVCLVCERRVKNCPICSVKKTESFKINLP